MTETDYTTAVSQGRMVLVDGYDAIAWLYQDRVYTVEDGRPQAREATREEVRRAFGVGV